MYPLVTAICDRRCWLAVLPTLLLLYASVSWGDSSALSDWRQQISRTQKLAENNAPSPLREAQRLQSELPADASPTGRARLLNLLSRIKAYLIRIEDAVAHAQQAQHQWVLSLLGGVSIVMVGVLLLLAQQRRSNRRLAEINRELQAGEQRYRTLVESLPDFVVRYDCNYRRILVNSAYYRITGLTEAAVIGKTPMETSFAWSSNIKAEEFCEYMRSVLENRKAVNLLFKFSEGVSSGRHPTYYEYRLIPEFAADGSLIGLLGIGRDVSDMQVLLQESEAEFRTLVEHSPDMIVCYDRFFRRTYVNPTYIRLNGEIGDAVLGKAPSGVFLDDEEVKSYQSELENVLASGVSCWFQMKWPAPQGGWMHFHVIAVPEFDEKGAVRGVLVIGRDMTNQKELELQLQESQTMLRALVERNESIREAERRHLAREVHDEMGQMLNVVRLNLIVLERRFGRDNPEMQSVVGTMLEHLGNTIAMARDIVLALHPAVLDAGIALALDWLARGFGKSTGIVCNLTVDESIALDKDQSMLVFRIVQESLTNVARHSSANAVEVSLMRDDDAFWLRISDDGRGFDASQPRTSKSLGLVGMRERVFMLGGTLDLVSAPGKGTILRIRFPVMQMKEVL